jgi:hypothetical protein
VKRIAPVASVADLDTLQTLAHPLRLRVLALLREPASAGYDCAIREFAGPARTTL